MTTEPLHHTGIHGLDLAIQALGAVGTQVYDNAVLGRYDLVGGPAGGQSNLTALQVIQTAKGLALQTARAALLERRIYTYENRQYPGLFDLVHPGLPRRDGLSAEDVIAYAEALK